MTHAVTQRQTRSALWRDGLEQQMEKNIERRTLTVEEAGEILGVGRNSAYEAVRTGQIPVIRIGRRLLVPRAALERLLSGGRAA